MNKLENDIILSHSGKQHSYHVAKALNDLGRLKKFYTSSYITHRRFQNYFLKSGNTFWSRRFQEGLYGDKVESNWRFELKEILYSKLFGLGERMQNAVYHRDINFDSYMARKLKKFDASIFWGFQGSCHASLQAAKVSGKRAFCELATAHVITANKILHEEIALHPQWADSFDIVDFPKYYEMRLAEEPHLADLVIAASTFTKNTLLEDGVPERKIAVLPLGVDVNRIQFDEQKMLHNSKPLKILYVGRITQKKGIVYLLEAMKKFRKKEVELHVIGYLHGKGEGLKSYKGQFYQHRPLSQVELFQQYANYDVLVLPSVFEGFGLVLVEAMAAGLPVIATPHTLGPDVIKDDRNGYLVPIRDVDAIVKAIEKFLSKNEDEWYDMKKYARETATRYSWDAYQQRLKFFLEGG